MFISIKVDAQICGCTDNNANNYNNNATINDGSCIYDKTIYHPNILIDSLPDIINETSGLIYYNGGLWTHNDSDRKPEIYKFDTITGHILQTVKINNAVNIDWEDITQDSNYIYVGDFGNNSGDRTNLKIYKISKKNITKEKNISVNASIINFSFSDQTEFVSNHCNNNFDCEAFFCFQDSLYLFSKNWIDKKTKLYVLPSIQGNYIATLIDSFNVNGFITGADINISANEITLIGYCDYIPFVWLFFDFKGNKFFSGNKRRIDISGLDFVQTEGITYTYNKNILISAEKSAVLQSLYRINAALWINSKKKQNIRDK